MIGFYVKIYKKLGIIQSYEKVSDDTYNVKLNDNRGSILLQYFDNKIFFHSNFLYIDVNAPEIIDKSYVKETIVYAVQLKDAYMWSILDSFDVSKVTMQ